MVAATALVSSRDSGFEATFEREYSRVASIAFRITRDAAEAEDVAQEVFARFIRARVEPQRAGGWLYRAAAHLALNAVRARRRRIERELREHRLKLHSADGEARASDPQGIVERRFEREALQAALLRIAQRDAELLALRYSGLSYREIASALGIDAAQIGTRLARAERALKREIET
jgi:RNA polymerase sigma factor (sigma-70 family)